MTAAVAAALMLLLWLHPASAQQGPTATRSFDPGVAAPGGEVTVTIAVAGYGAFGVLIETLPEGFTYVSGSLDVLQVEVTGRTVTFTLLGDTSFTYTVTAPASEGSYGFRGVLWDADRNEHAVGGASEITVGVVTPGPTAEPTAEPTPTPTPTASPAATPTPQPATEPTPTPEPTPELTPTPTSAPSPEPTATPARAPTATPTSAPEAASTVTPTSSPTARPTPTPLPTVPVVSVDEGGGMPAWVIPAVVVAALLALIAGTGVFITSRQRQR